MLGCGDAAGTDAGTATLVPTDEQEVVIDTLSFSGTAVGQQNGSRLRITNTGTIVTGPIALSITGSAANDFGIDNQQTTCAAVTLVPGASCDVAVVFHPLLVGSRSATLTITSEPGGSVTIALAGNAFMPELHFNPPAIDFGQIAIGQLAVQSTIELRNDGSSPAVLDSIVVAGAAFSRSSSTCGASLDPGTSCDVVLIADPQALGATSGSVTVASGGTGYSAALSARGARRVNVIVSGTGAGTITSSPAGIDCGTTCTALFETDVVLTALPNANTQITSWSIAGCGASATCTVGADITPIDVHVTFSLTGTSELQLVYAGNAPGDVQVRRQSAVGGSRTVCFGSCTVPIDPGETITISTATASLLGGISGACSNPAGSGNCSFVAPVGISTVTVTFDKNPNELWTRFLASPVIAVAYDTTGNVIAATASGLTKLSGTGATIWSRALPVSALATGPNDTIYVVSASELKKLDASSADLWTRPLDANSQTDCRNTVIPLQCIAVGAVDGSVAVHSTVGVTRWDTNGNTSFSTPIAASFIGVAIDGLGIVYAATLDVEHLDAVRFLPDGMQLPAWPSFVALQPTGEFAIDSDGRLVSSSSGHGNNHFVRMRADGTLEYTKLFDGTFPAELENGVAASASGRIAWWYYEQDNFDRQRHHVSVFTNAGAAQFDLDRTRFRDPFDSTVLGPAPVDASFSAGGQLVFGGVHDTFTGTVGWVQTYAP